MSHTYYSIEARCDFCEVCESIVEPDDVTGELTCMECLYRLEPIEKTVLSFSAETLAFAQMCERELEENTK